MIRLRRTTPFVIYPCIAVEGTKTQREAQLPPKKDMVMEPVSLVSPALTDGFFTS